ncbi:MAG: DEAD/DEAH box helicase [Acidimicrobiales bacterium]
MSRSVTLRAWQREALTRFADARPSSFLAVACPGAGKTTFALAAARQRLAGEHLPIVVVVPTQHLKTQWAEAGLRFGFHLDPDWSAAAGRLPADMHGIVVTYAQAASSARVLRELVRGGFAILDEVHHAASDRSWGDGVRVAFEEAWCRLLLSGTPFRTDDNPIPFVEYTFGDYGEAMPDYEYGYGEALTEGGVVRPVFFPRFDGHMEWLSAEGEERSATFDDEVLRTEWGARLRTALSVEGQWLPTVVDHAHHRLTEIRTEHPDAAGLIIATDHEHARGIASMIERRHGVTPSIALSDDPNASRVIERFGASSDQWIVAVRMISEGVDIPRLRVGVFATTTTTAMFFRQAVGRIARWTAGLRSQRAYMYLPDDPRLRVHAASIAQQRRHSIDKRRERDGDDPAALDELRRPPGGEEQMSLFAALSSTVLTAAPPTDGLDPHEDLVARPDDMVGYPVDLPPPPPLPGRGDAPSPGGGLASIRTRKQEKESLRTRNADRVRAIVNLTGQSHAQINGELNRLAGIDRITEATVAQLEKRLVEADKWLSRLA